MGVLTAADFSVQITYHQTEQNIRVQLFLGQDMILPISHIENWRYMCHRKQAQVEKYIIRENSTRIDYDYNIGDKVMVRRNQAYKYETPFQGPYEIIQMWKNGTVII